MTLDHSRIEPQPQLHQERILLSLLRRATLQSGLNPEAPTYLVQAARTPSLLSSQRSYVTQQVKEELGRRGADQKQP